MPDITSNSVEIASGSIQGGSIDGAQLNNCSGIMTTNGDTQPLHLQLTLNEPLPIPFIHVEWCIYSINRGVMQVSLDSDTQISMTPYDSTDETPLEGQPFSFRIFKLGPR